MFRFLSRLFSPPRTAADLSPWPYPLRPQDEQQLFWHSVRVAGVTVHDKDAEMVDLLVEARAAGPRVQPASIGEFMTPDDLSAFGLDRRLRISARFFLCLNETARKNPTQAEWRLVRISVTAIGNRAALNRMVQELSPKQMVALTTYDNPCPQCLAFNGPTWASVAPDLPLPGCNSKHCLCMHHAVFEL